jgi:hypothetical protein
MSGSQLGPGTLPAAFSACTVGFSVWLMERFALLFIIILPPEKKMAHPPLTIYLMVRISSSCCIVSPI